MACSVTCSILAPVRPGFAWRDGQHPVEQQDAPFGPRGEVPGAGRGKPRSSPYSRKILTRLGGSLFTSGATEKLRPTGCPGVG